MLLIGAGGLGSPAALYLAAAGVGTIGIVDDDTVDPSNLQRQVLHTLDRIGMAKVDSAREAITSLNPDVKVETHAARLDSSNVLDIMSAYDLVVDGGDNFPTRYLVNDASLHLGIPVVHGSIFRFEGQVTVFDPYQGPAIAVCTVSRHLRDRPILCRGRGLRGPPGCDRIHPGNRGHKASPRPGAHLTGRLLVFDALEQDFTALPIRRPGLSRLQRPGPAARLVDYDETCRPVA